MYKKITDTHREALTSVLGAPLDMCPLEPKILERESLDGYTRLKVRYQVHPHEYVPAYVLLPDGITSPCAAVVCPHPQGEDWSVGKSWVVGSETALGVELARHGYVVLAPDALGYEERTPDPINGFEYRWGEFAARLLRGETLLRKAIWDVSRGIDFLETLEEVNLERIGVVGQGTGALMALWAAAIDERVAAGAGHGSWTSLRELVRLHLPIPLELTVPRLLQVADLDRILAQVAPRPFLMSAMKDDPTSLDPDMIYLKASQIYEAFEIDNPLTLYHHEPNTEDFPADARNQFYGWLDKWLRDGV